MTMMMTFTMIATTALVLALLAAVPSCEATTTHRRTTGTELYRVQPTQNVRSLVAATSSSSKTDFDRFDDDAKRALRELMTFPVARHLEVSMEYLSLSFAPIISMSMTPPPTTTMTKSPTPVPAVLPVEGVPGRGSGGDTGGNNNTNNNNNVAAVHRVAGGRENGTTNDFNKPATISVTVFLLIAALAVTALVVRKYKRVVMMTGGTDDQSILTGSVFSNNNEPGQNIPSPV
jgi:hypothetical protein